MLGDYEQGLVSSEKAIELIGGDDDPFMRYIYAASLDSIGYAHLHLGHYRDAVASYQDALRIYESYGEVMIQAIVFDHLGDAYLAAADSCAARDAWQQALAVLDDLRHPGAEQVRAKLHALAGPSTGRPGGTGDLET